MEDSDSHEEIDTLAGTMAGFGVRKVFNKTSSVLDDFTSQSSKPLALPMKYEEDEKIEEVSVNSLRKTNTPRRL